MSQFSWIQHINKKYIYEKYSVRRALEEYCNTGQFDTDIDYFTGQGYTFNRACIEAINKYYEENLI